MMSKTEDHLQEIYLNHNLKFAQFTDGALRQTDFCLIDLTTGGSERVRNIAGTH